MENITQFRPDFVFLQIGGNDIPVSSDKTPESLAKEISDNLFLLARRIVIETNCQSVYVGQLLFRQLGPYNIRTEEQKVYYNNVMCLINRRMHQLSTDKKNDGPINIVFWFHRGLKYPLSNTTCGDGTHFNKHGQVKYFDSIRRALAHARNGQSASRNKSGDN